VANLREDALHKLTTSVAAEYGTIVVEDLNVAGMLRNRRLARRIADAGFGEIRRQLTYKTRQRHATRTVVADRWYPSSKTCSGCGAVKAKLPLHVRTYECDTCGLVIDRDDNAALNLAALAAACSTGTGVAGDRDTPKRVPKPRGADQKTRVTRTRRKASAGRAGGATLPHQRQTERETVLKPKPSRFGDVTDLPGRNARNAESRLGSEQRIRRKAHHRTTRMSPSAVTRSSRRSAEPPDPGMWAAPYHHSVRGVPPVATTTLPDAPPVPKAWGDPHRAAPFDFLLILTTMPTLTITQVLFDQIVAHARKDHPDEACGVVAGPAGTDRPERFIPMLNAARSPTFYEFDSQDLLKLYREMDDRDEEPVIIYHSHTATEAYPSRTDLSYANEPGAHYVLVSTADTDDAGPFQFRSYRIVEGEITEEDVKVVEAY